MRDYLTRAAAVTKWNAAPTCQLAVPGGIFEGDKAEKRPATTYAILVVKPDGKPNIRTSGNGMSTDNEVDFRRMTISVYGLSEAIVVAALQTIDAVFSDRRDTYPANALTYPGGAAGWIRTEPVAEVPDRIERAEKTEAGQWWKGTLEYRVWSSWNH